jgi:hypothetical protein
VLPIRSNIAHWLAGFLVLGLSSRLNFDDRYLHFCELVTSQIATVMASASELVAELTAITAGYQPVLDLLPGHADPEQGHVFLPIDQPFFLYHC